MDRACLLEALHESLYIYCWRDLFCLKRGKKHPPGSQKEFLFMLSEAEALFIWNKWKRSTSSHSNLKNR